MDRHGNEHIAYDMKHKQCTNISVTAKSQNPSIPRHMTWYHEALRIPNLPLRMAWFHVPIIRAQTWKTGSNKFVKMMPKDGLEIEMHW